MHPILMRKDYKTPDGNNFYCKNIGLGVADSLIQEGQRPFLMRFESRVIEDGELWTELLFPKPFAGRVKWGSHTVCCVLDENKNTVVYDPIAKTPLPQKEYEKYVFGKPLQGTVISSQIKTRELVERQKQAARLTAMMKDYL